MKKPKERLAEIHMALAAAEKKREADIERANANSRKARDTEVRRATGLVAPIGRDATAARGAARTDCEHARRDAESVHIAAVRKATADRDKSVHAAEQARRLAIETANRIESEAVAPIEAEHRATLDRVGLACREAVAEARIACEMTTAALLSERAKEEKRKVEKSETEAA